MVVVSLAMSIYAYLAPRNLFDVVPSAGPRLQFARSPALPGASHPCPFRVGSGTRHTPPGRRSAVDPRRGHHPAFAGAGRPLRRRRGSPRGHRRACSARAGLGDIGDAYPDTDPEVERTRKSKVFPHGNASRALKPVGLAALFNVDVTVFAEGAETRSREGGDPQQPRATC